MPYAMMMEVETQQQIGQLAAFNAAVDVIQNLPKDGPFQPSTEMKLKFYACYKQATLGPCTASKPAFYDIINRKKWEAWNALGNMPQEEARQNYIDMLKEICETMPHGPEVEAFLNVVAPFYEFVRETDMKNMSITKPLASNGSIVMNGDSDRHVLNGPSLTAPLTVDTNSAAASLAGDFSSVSFEKIPINNTKKSAKNDSPGRDSGFSDQHHAAVNGFPHPKTDEEAAISEEEIFADAEDSGEHIVTTAEVVALTADDPSMQSIVLRKSAGVGPDSPPPVRSHQHKKRPSLTPKQRQAVAGLGSLIRDFPESDLAASAAAIAAYDRVFDEAWDAVAKVKADQQKVAGKEERLLRSMKTKKSRGRDDGNPPTGGSGGDPGSVSTGNPASAGTGGDHSSAIAQSLQQASRSTRNRSGEGSDSSGSSLEVIDFDPQVSQVLLRMHQELRNISRQMELMEGILLTQQHMIRNTLALVAERTSFRLLVFPKLPWRTIIFILVWPFAVNILVRLFGPFVVRVLMILFRRHRQR